MMIKLPNLCLSSDNRLCYLNEKLIKPLEIHTVKRLLNSGGRSFDLYSLGETQRVALCQLKNMSFRQALPEPGGQ
jgi:hypothetical protein